MLASMVKDKRKAGSKVKYFLRKERERKKNS